MINNRFYVMIHKLNICMVLLLFMGMIFVKPALAKEGEKDKKMGNNYYESLFEKKNNPFGLDFIGGMSLPMSPAGTVAKGVDISYHNGDIDFAKLKNEVDFVIIRCGYGEDDPAQDDVKFLEYVKSCKDYDIPYGVYIYSYADSQERAYSEAEHTIRLLNKSALLGTEPKLPVFLDLEDSSTIYTSAQTKGDIARIYCGMLEMAGYQTGIYANKSWWETYLTDPYFDHVIKWVAQYNDTCTYQGFYDIWQCSESARVDAISTNVDYNYMITDLLSGERQNYIINQCDITEISNQEYTGDRIRPEVEVSYHGTKLTPSLDYVLTYGENTDTGSGEITITGMGRFSGSETISFAIVPGKVTLIDANAGESNGVLKWRKVDGASGYQVALMKKGETKWKYYQTRQTMVNVANLDQGEWIVKVRAFVTINGSKYLGEFGNKKTLVLRSKNK